MRKIITGLLAVAALIAGTALLPSPAQAALGDNRCITKTEFRNVTKGTSITRAHNIIDYRGSQDFYDSGYPGEYGWPASQTREYKQCGTKYGSAYIDYEKKGGVWRTTGKYAFWS